jgi:hypothetical protein
MTNAVPERIYSAQPVARSAALAADPAIGIRNPLAVARIHAAQPL